MSVQLYESQGKQSENVTYSVCVCMCARAYVWRSEANPRCPSWLLRGDPSLAQSSHSVQAGWQMGLRRLPDLTSLLVGLPACIIVPALTV